MTRSVLFSLLVFSAAAAPARGQNAVPFAKGQPSFAELAIPHVVGRALEAGGLNHPTYRNILVWLHRQLPSTMYDTSRARCMYALEACHNLGARDFWDSQTGVLVDQRRAVPTEQEKRAIEDLYRLGADFVPYLVGAAASRAEPYSFNASVLLWDHVQADPEHPEIITSSIRYARCFRTYPYMRGSVPDRARLALIRWNRTRRESAPRLYDRWLSARRCRKSFTVEVVLWPPLAFEYDKSPWFAVIAEHSANEDRVAFGDGFELMCAGRHVGFVIAVSAIAFIGFRDELAAPAESLIRDGSSVRYVGPALRPH